MNASKLFLTFTLSIGAMLYLSGCMTEPVTGRRQINIIPQGQEMQLGLTSFEQLKKEVPISKDPTINALVQKVGKRIAAVAEMPNAQWEFVVFENKEANAFCLPGGKVGIYTGILPITKDESGLATVIGHEVAHATARHGGERMTIALASQGIGTVINASMADSKWQAATATAYGAGSQLLVALPHSRLQEYSADEIGMIYMARAGYDPGTAIDFWQRFSDYNKKQGGETLWFLRTHPLDQDRVKKLQEWLPRARQEYNPNP